MRLAFCRALLELAADDPRILLLTGDLGYTVLEPFAEKFPGRFFNAGVAEQNMVGMATGLAEAGFIPYLYSIATFASLRPYEFIRNGPAPPALARTDCGGRGRIRIQSRWSHPSRSRRPGDHAHSAWPDDRLRRRNNQQARSAALATAHLPGPVYYRLGKDDATIIPGLNGRFNIGDVQVIAEGHDLLLISTGAIAHEAAMAAKTLADQGISTTVAIVSSFHPAPVEISPGCSDVCRRPSQSENPTM